MSSKTDNRESVRQESGVFLVVVAIALVAIFMVIGLGIDGGTMFLNGLTQQRTADAAALAGGRVLGRVTDEEAREIARDVAQDNFVLNNIVFDDTDINAHFDVPAIVDNEISVTTSASVPTFIAGRITPGPEQVNVRAAARAKRNYPAVILVIDNTVSMSWAARDRNGNVMRDGNGNVLSKLDVTKVAAINFIAQFSERDKVGIVKYSTSTDVVWPLSNDFDLDAMTAAINGIGVTGSTNIQIGLLQALREMERWLNLATTDRTEWPARYIVLMTDGVPNHNAQDHNQRRDLMRDWFTEDGPDPDSDPDPVAYPTFPGSALCRSGSGVRQQNFVHAQIAANFIRSYGHTVIAVAVGPQEPAANFSDTNPWGTSDVFSEGNIRGNFMRWLANDYQGSLEQDPADQAFPADCVDSYDDMAASGYGEGLALIAPSAADIDGMFQTVASYIALRLTS